MKIALTVEMEVDKTEVDFDFTTGDLVGELVKVKSGHYENCFYGTITSATIEPPRKYRGKTSREQ